MRRPEHIFSDPPVNEQGTNSQRKWSGVRKPIPLHRNPFPQGDDVHFGTRRGNSRYNQGRSQNPSSGDSKNLPHTAEARLITCGQQYRASQFERTVSNWEWKLSPNSVTVTRNFAGPERNDGVESGKIIDFL